MATKQESELARLAEARRKNAKPKDENPIKDGPNPILDEQAVKIAQELADKYGMEKLQRLFPDMAALLEESDG